MGKGMFVIQLSEAIEQMLQGKVGDLNRGAKKAMLIEFFRTCFECARSLGLDRFETDALLNLDQHKI
jgi:hypothetical protein